MTRRTVVSETKIQALIDQQGMTLHELGVRAGFSSPEYIYRAVRGRERVTLETLNKVAAALGKSACDLTEIVDA